MEERATFSKWVRTLYSPSLMLNFVNTAGEPSKKQALVINAVCIPNHMLQNHNTLPATCT
eukprot:6151065-Karenia_brevis.AAC.1